MNLSDFKFSENVSSTNDIYIHLIKCSDLFKPSLDSYIDIKQYSIKIRDHADTIECWKNDMLIGLVAIYLNDIKYIEGYVTNVSVVKEYQNLGISSNLLLTSIEKAKKNKFRRLNLEVFINNIAAINLYKKYSFRIKKVNEDKLVMTKEL